jgi:thymidylate synthase (FAD)
MVVSKKIAGMLGVGMALETALLAYKELVDDLGVPPEEARQVLPNAAAVNLIWTVNARALANFFEQRLCHRNVEEMQVIAGKILDQVYETWFDYAACVGPTCYTQRKCNQGAMSCGEPYK